MEEIAKKFIQVCPEYEGQLKDIKNIMKRVKIEEDEENKVNNKFGKDVYSMLKKIFRAHLVIFYFLTL